MSAPYRHDAATSPSVAQLLHAAWQEGEFTPPAGGRTGGPRMVQALTRGTLDLLYPPVCPLTGKNLADAPNPWLSEAALAALPVLEAPVCLRCGGPQETPSKNTAMETRCRRCANCAGRFEHSVCLWAYEGVGRELLLAFKFGGQRHLAPLLGRWLYATGRARGLFEANAWIVPAPGSQALGTLTAEENHALQLARAVVAADARSDAPVGLQLLRGGLRKVRATTPQALLPLAQRLAEPENSMQCDEAESVTGQSVVVIDDVLTTLATATEAARALLAAGAREVRLLALARTL